MVAAAQYIWRQELSGDEIETVLALTEGLTDPLEKAQGGEF